MQRTLLLMLRIPLLFLGLAVFQPSSAQFNYTFSAFSGTYTELSSGTDVNSIEVDDAHSSGFSPIPLGFTFQYDGQNVTLARVNSNGWLSLSTGDSPSSTEGRDNSVMATADNATRPALMPLWDNLNGTGGTARYSTTGTAGSRVFTMEWRNWRWGSGATGPVMSFQCKIYEGTSAIQFIYRREGTNVSSGSGSIGILGGSSGEYYSLNGTGSSPTASTSTATTNLSAKPATGQVYQFTPCVSPAGNTAGITSNCSSGTYAYVVNVTSLGSSSGVNIVSSPGGTLHTNVGLGSHAVGPFTFGTATTITIVGNAGCSTALASVNVTDPDGVCHASGTYPIPDNGCATLNMRNVPFCVSSTGTQLGTDVFVRSVDAIVSHAWGSDLRLNLIAPDGTTVGLVNAAHGGSGTQYGNASACPGGLFTFIGGGTSMSSVATNSTNVGNWTPDQPLTGFHNGSDPNGTWTLQACDAVAQDNGAVRFARVNLCRPVQATITRSSNCANDQFSVAVGVTGFGTGTSATIQYTVNGGSPTTLNGVGLGTTTLGPFASSAVIAVTVTNGLTNCGSVQGTMYSSCPVILDCGATLNVTHCYQNNDQRSFTYVSPIPGETVTLTFVQGSLDLSDVVNFYDGTDNLATPLGGGNFFGNLAGFTVTSTGPAIFMEIGANGTNSCADGGQGTPWLFEAKCTPGCQPPAGFVDVFNDCNTYTFTLDLNVFYAGDGANVEVVHTVNGGTPVSTPGVLEGGVVNLGPFTIGDQVSIVLRHATDPLCNTNMGTFTNTVACPSAENCVNALNLATQSSPLPGTTVGRVNDFSFACGTATANTALDAIYYIDVPNGHMLSIRQQSNTYDSQHYVRYGGACPGSNVIVCIDDEAGEVGWVTWPNTTGTTQRVWWIQDGYQANTGSFVLEWNVNACPTPTANAATLVHSTGATANFTGFAGDYIVEYGPASTFTTPGTGAAAGANGTILTTTHTPTALTGLAPSTQYRYFVRRVCGDGVFSSNSSGITFTTTNGVVVTNGACGLSHTIPNSGCGSSYLNALITMSGLNSALGVDVGLESLDFIITHADRTEIEMVLISPSGQSRNMVLDRGTSSDNFGNNGSCPTAVFKLRDGGSALSSIPNTNNVVGTYAPEQSLAGFTGDPNGTWTLRICDDSFFNSGGALRYARLNFQVIDCLGVLGGTALPGTSCNDGNACTINDTYGPTCTCAGTIQDTDADGTCDANDGCPNDPAKTSAGACGCGNVDVATTYYADTDGDGSGDPAAPLAGFTCTVPVGHVANSADGCPADPLKVVPGVCGCGVTDMDSDNDGTADCFDGCDNDPLKTAPGQCGCGNADTDTDFDSTADCNDGCPNDPLKVAPGICGCGVVDLDSDSDGIADCNDNCPTLFGQIGSPCDDGSHSTVLDQINGSCVCAGIACTEQVNMEVALDMHGSQISWRIAQEGTNAMICSGGITIPYPDNVAFPIVETCCLPVGCYTLSVFDSAGDGILGGGYQLREGGLNGRRIVDNTGNFTTGSSSSIAGGQDFCVPLGTDKLIFSSCDKMDWVANRYVIASANPAVSATWVPNGPDNVQPTNSGYEFWIFDPNGGYSYRRFRSHHVSDGFSPASSSRACHMKLNGWFNSGLTPHVPTNMLMNVKVRGRVNGVNQPFGATCRLKIDPVRAACPLVKLQDDPANTNDFSCGVLKNFGGTNSPANRIVALPPQFAGSVPTGNVRYQFRFRIPGENVCIIRPPQTSATLNLNWNSGVPLQCGKTYKVDVRVSKDQGVSWCVDANTPTCEPGPVTLWGKVCDVTINPCLQGGGAENLGSTISLGSSAPILYPNPNNGNQLNIQWALTETDQAQDVYLMIYDLTGKRLHERTFTGTEGILSTTVDLGSNLVDGVYLVHLTRGDRSYTERLIIQR